MPILALVLLAIVVGVLIGTVGVGGVALPPFLTWFGGFDPHTAAGTSSWAFVFTGVVATVMYARHSSMSWRLVRWLALGAVPGALAGSWANGYVPDAYAMAPLALLVTAAGARHLWSILRARQQAPDRVQRTPGHMLPQPFEPTLVSSRGTMVLTGLGVGFASALTGTGGPVFLVPALLMLGVPALTAVAAAQVVQLPLVIAAVLGYARQGAIDFGTGSLIGVLASLGVVAGVLIATRLPPRVLSLTTGFALAGFGALLTGSTVLTLLG